MSIQTTNVSRYCFATSIDFVNSVACAIPGSSVELKTQGNFGSVNLARFRSNHSTHEQGRSRKARGFLLLLVVDQYSRDGCCLLWSQMASILAGIEEELKQASLNVIPRVALRKPVSFHPSLPHETTQLGAILFSAAHRYRSFPVLSPGTLRGPPCTRVPNRV